MGEDVEMEQLMCRFEGKRIVITGAGRGLGFAYAQRLGREGASIVIAEIDEKLCRLAESELQSQGIDARAIAADVTSEESMQKVAAFAAEGCDGIHGLVTNAGWANNVGGRLYNEIPTDVWDRMMSINVKGTWLAVRAVGPLIKDGGAIITVSSDCIFWGAPRLLHYATSKSAIIGMTRSLARELGERHIRVNCIAPGLTVVEATKDISEQRWNDYAERQLIKRKQLPEDVHGVIAFLLSDDARFITGQTIAVDGGFALH